MSSISSNISEEDNKLKSELALMSFCIILLQ